MQKSLCSLHIEMTTVNWETISIPIAWNSCTLCDFYSTLVFTKKLSAKIKFLWKLLNYVRCYTRNVPTLFSNIIRTVKRFALSPVQEQKYYLFFMDPQEETYVVAPSIWQNVSLKLIEEENILKVRDRFRFWFNYFLFSRFEIMNNYWYRTISA